MGDWAFEVKGRAVYVLWGGCELFCLESEEESEHFGEDIRFELMDEKEIQAYLEERYWAEIAGQIESFPNEETT